MKPTYKQVRKYLVYEPETGFIRWAKKTGYKPIVGNIAGGKRQHGYEAIGFLGRRWYVHQLAWLWMTGKWPKEIDHKDGDRANNKWENLRLATRFQNNGNRKPQLRKVHPGLPKGVVKVRNRGGSISYRGRITINDKQVHLGSFTTPQEAHQAYILAAKKFFGEFAKS